LTLAEIDEYLTTRQWVGCSGAYAIKEEGDPLLTVDGSVTNVVGLPLESLARWLPLRTAGGGREWCAAGCRAPQCSPADILARRGSCVPCPRGACPRGYIGRPRGPCPE